MTEPGDNKTIGKWRRPGFLLEPLGWVQDRLSQAIEVEPRPVERCSILITPECISSR